MLPGKAKLIPQNNDSNHPNPSQWSFTMPGHPQLRVQVYTRSVYGLYRYIGELVRLSSTQATSSFPMYDGNIFNGGILSEAAHLTNAVAGCWTAISYNGDHWCVPASANGTKRTFALLHLLFRLYASPSNQTVTPTVRVTQ